MIQTAAPGEPQAVSQAICGDEKMTRRWGVIGRWATALTVASCALPILAMTVVFGAEERYRRAEILQVGRLRIVTTDGREIIPQKRHEQVGFDEVAITEDGRAVGWLALYDNCCTSYPIPHELVIVENGQAREFTGNGLPIWRWGFAAGGKQLAFRQETVHGGIGMHYELRDVTTGQLVAEYSPGPENRGEPPKWVGDLDPAR